MGRIAYCILLTFTLWTGGMIYHSYLEDIIDLSILYTFPVFVILIIALFLVMFFVRVDLTFKFIPVRLHSLVLFLASCIGVVVILHGFHAYRNYSPNIFNVMYFNEEGIWMELKENGTFRVKNDDFVSMSVTYGKYKMVNSEIIVNKRLYFSNAPINDTLIVHGERIEFTLDKEVRGVTRAFME